MLLSTEIHSALKLELKIRPFTVYVLYMGHGCNVSRRQADPTFVFFYFFQTAGL